VLVLLYLVCHAFASSRIVFVLDAAGFAFNNPARTTSPAAASGGLSASSDG
jgi:hypothetical protein